MLHLMVQLSMHAWADAHWQKIHAVIANSTQEAAKCFKSVSIYDSYLSSQLCFSFKSSCFPDVDKALSHHGQPGSIESCAHMCVVWKVCCACLIQKKVCYSTRIN